MRDFLDSVVRNGKICPRCKWHLPAASRKETLAGQGPLSSCTASKLIYPVGEFVYPATAHALVGMSKKAVIVLPEHPTVLLNHSLLPSYKPFLKTSYGKQTFPTNS